MNQFSSRKFIAGFILLAIGLIVTYEKGDIPPNLLNLMQWIYIAFVSGNAVEHVSQLMKKDIK